MTEFFDQLIETLQNEALRRPGVNASQETLKELFSDSLRKDLSPEPDAGVSDVNLHASAAPRPSGNFPQSAGSAEEKAAPGQPLIPGTLEHLAETVRHCRGCQLCRTRLNAVPGEGNPHARLMFIGEGPGADEDRQGRPFVGAAGQLLDKMILAMQFRREDVYIANIVKCRPPRNRAPMPEEAAACIGYLEHQIRMIKPEVIVVLGATAAHFLLKREEGIMRLRGRWLEYDGIPVMPTFHPAFLLRQESAKREAWEDLKQVMRRLGILIPVPGRRAR